MSLMAACTFAALARSGNDRTSPQTLMRRGELVFLNELKKRKE